MGSMAVMNQVLILFLIALIGIAARKKGIISDSVRSGLTDLILDITLPLMTLVSFNQSFSRDTLYNAGVLAAFSFAITGGTYFLSRLLYYKYPDSIKSVLRYSSVFSNAAFMGYPVVQAMYGSLGIFYASIYMIPFRIFMWSLGVALFTRGNGKENLRKIFLNPTIIATFIGLAAFLTRLKFPDVLNQTFDMVGSTTTPLAMIVIGALLGDMKIRDLFAGFAVFYYSAVRLLILPAAVYAILGIFRADKAVLDITVLLTAMPAATMTAILAERYNANAAFASKCVFISTAFSIVTIPLIVLMIH